MAPATPDRSMIDLPHDVVVRALSVIPIPAAMVERTDGVLRVIAANDEYRAAGFAASPDASSLLTAMGGRIVELLDSARLRLHADWQIGAAIDGRFYRVTIARGSTGIRHRCVVSLVDCTTERHTERSLRREMKTDSLTGLPNREGFGDIAEAAMAEPARRAVLVVDLARFGRINACLGSLAGDELLITVARRIKGALRGQDTLARIGSDEFGILLMIDDDPGEARALGERVRQALATPFRLTDFEISVDCSIGVAFGSGEGGDEPEEMIRHAQFATKRAKASGRVEAYHNQAFAIARAQFGMETDLRRAIERRRLRLMYQPIWDLATGRLVSFEALARWTADDGTELAPANFIPVAEESGLIVPLGRWAINEAATTLAGWDAASGGDCGARVAVNLSAIQLQRDVIAPVVQGALDRTGLAGSRFTLELTESAIVSDPDRVADTMQALKALGTLLAMDDFGTGYSNLAYLQKLPIDILKIDRSFVTGMLADRDKVAIVRAILGLAQALGMLTTAEGIETMELAQTLRAMGCTYGQGYAFARPLEADAALAMLVAARA